MMHANSRQWALTGCLLLLASCGGGGGSSPPPMYEISTSSGSGGSLSPASRTIQSGSTTNFTISAETGYELDSVSGCGGTLDGSTFTTGQVNGDCTITASFSKIVYALSASYEGGGTVSPGSQDVEHGERAVFDLDLDPGYLIDSIAGCGGTLDGDEYVIEEVTESCEISAVFRLPRVTGRIHAIATSAADTTVNDPNASHVPNDTIPEAQDIPNPITVGGYANIPGEGEDGRSLVEGDEFDVYRVALVGGQFIVLELESDDLATDDLDLYVINQDEQIVDSSLGIEAEIEFVHVPPGADDIYYVVVHAFSGATNYTLTIGHIAANVQQHGWRLSDDFLAGEAVVKVEADRELDRSSFSQGIVFPEDMEVDARNRHYNFSAGQEHAVPAAGNLRRGLLQRVGFAEPHLESKYDTLLRIKELNLDPDIEHAYPNFLYDMQGSHVPNDPLFVYQWHYSQIGVTQAWQLSTGADTVVAVADSGVALDHPDLLGQLVPGYDFVADEAGGGDPGISPTPPGGSGFHGTHVAGTIGAVTGNNLGVAGLAFDARIMPLRVCDLRCSSYAIEQALRFAAGLPNDSGMIPDRPADIINLSLGRSGSPVPAEQELFNQLRDAGIFVVGAAGNNGSEIQFYPAAYDGVLAVGAVDMSLEKASYSNFGDWLDLVAPGGDRSRDVNADGHGDGVISTFVDDRQSATDHTYHFMQGTSMAAPHVSGVLALMKSIAPDLQPHHVDMLLANGTLTDDLGESGRNNEFGYGQVNAYKAAVEAANFDEQDLLAEPYLVVSPNALNFGSALTEITIKLTNAGGGDLVLGSPTENSGGWLFGESQIVDDDTLWTIRVDRDDLPEGAYEATLNFPSNANDVNVRVYMEVASAQGPDVGELYVLLIDVDNHETQNGAISEREGEGEYSFRVDEVELGEYLLVAGSDFDNDFFICGSGESCGVYRGFGDLVLIDVDGEDIEGLEFNAGYRAQPATQSTNGEQQGYRRLVPGRMGVLERGERGRRSDR